MPSLIKTDDYVTVTMDDGDTFTVTRNQNCFPHVINAIRARDFEAARQLSNPKTMLKAHVTGKVQVEGSTVRYDGEIIDNTLTSRMIKMLVQGLDIRPMMLFMENLMQNPSSRAVNELYTFLEIGQLPITEDGHFLAYKRIRKDYKDCHSRSIDNSVGQLIKMSRRDVDDDSSHVCSTGLHFCSRTYCDQFYGERLIMVKINPKNVVSIPNDYNNTKGRCCEYLVLAEIEMETQIEGTYADTGSLTDILAGVKSVSFNTRAKAREFVRENKGFKFRDNGVKSTNRWGAVKQDQSV